MNKTNNAMSKNFKMTDFPEWVTGVKSVKGKKVFHYYLRNDFVFDWMKR